MLILGELSLSLQCPLCLLPDAWNHVAKFYSAHFIGWLILPLNTWFSVCPSIPTACTWQEQRRQGQPFACYWLRTGFVGYARIRFLLGWKQLNHFFCLLGYYTVWRLPDTTFIDWLHVGVLYDEWSPEPVLVYSLLLMFCPSFRSHFVSSMLTSLPLS